MTELKTIKRICFIVAAFVRGIIATLIIIAMFRERWPMYWAAALGFGASEGYQLGSVRKAMIGAFAGLAGYLFVRVVIGLASGQMF